MKSLILFCIGLLLLCPQLTYANDCDDTGDCNIHNICIDIDNSTASIPPLTNDTVVVFKYE